MERSRPVRKAHSHTSTADLLLWSEVSPVDSPLTGSAIATRSHQSQPSDRISKMLHGDQETDEDDELLEKKKPCSGYKLKEITGSGIFTAKDKEKPAETDNRTGLRMYQQAVNGISQISFSTEESVSHKKPSSIPEVAKQRELSGTLQSDSDAKNSKQISDAKCKELSGNDIFGPPEIGPRSLAASRNLELKGSKNVDEPAPRVLRTSVKVSNPAGGQSKIMFGDEPIIKTAKKINNQKFQELTGNDIFNGGVPPGSVEKTLSRAKQREMNGSDIFADGKSASRDYLGGVRKPPGGESTIALL